MNLKFDTSVTPLQFNPEYTGIKNCTDLDSPLDDEDEELIRTFSHYKLLCANNSESISLRNTMTS